jgi:hypothetical protein
LVGAKLGLRRAWHRSESPIHLGNQWAILARS